MLLASPHVTTLIRLCAGVLDPLRKAQVAVQTSNSYSVETVASMMACYNTFVTVVDTKATYELATKFCGDILEKTSGNASVSQVTCDGHIDYSIRDGAVLADLDELTVPQMSMTFPLAAERSTVIKAVQKFASPAIIAAAKKFGERVQGPLDTAQRRQAAALQLDVATYNFTSALEQPGAIPPSLRAADSGRASGAGAEMAAAVAAAADDLEDDMLGNTFRITLVTSFNEWANVCNAPGTLFYTEDDKAAPAQYWLRLRKSLQFRNLAETMLWWLTFPVGSAGVERSFSFMTAIGKQTTRRKLGQEAFTNTLLSMCYRKELETMLRRSLVRLKQAKS